MPKIDEPVLPTDFAVKICEKCGVIPKISAGHKNAKEIAALKEVLADFQRLATNSSFSVALIAFTGVELTQDQREALQVVYETTKPFILGLTLDACLQAVTHRHMSKSEYSEAIKTITELVKPPSIVGDAGKKAKGILIKINQK